MISNQAVTRKQTTEELGIYVVVNLFDFNVMVQLKLALFFSCFIFQLKLSAMVILVRYQLSRLKTPEVEKSKQLGEITAEQLS